MVMPDFGLPAERKVLKPEPIILNVSDLLEVDPQCPLKQFRINSTFKDTTKVDILQAPYNAVVELGETTGVLKLTYYETWFVEATNSVTFDINITNYW